MIKWYLKIVGVAVFCFLSNVGMGQSEADSNERHVMVTMRMIGHEILLKSGDSTSRILPVQKQNDRYEIRFESEFEFDPVELVFTVDSVMLMAGMAGDYIVEVEQCETEEVVYSYEKGYLLTQDMVPCGGRKQPKDCYTIFISLLNSGAGFQTITESTTVDSSTIEKKESSSVFFYLLIGAVTGIGLILFMRRKKTEEVTPDSDVFLIGKYRFDKKNMKLISEEGKVDLTSKEADLLYMLYSSVNETLERDQILRVVWGDEGDYVGRTLDVFISKLRKKLEGDSTVKIINVRGVGYKLILGAED
ncbi:MAG: response regulator transcription factor [Flavobacteriales bacterium]|nr:response regulator transcription factor [Flavobacteriales bacterium]